MKFTKTQEENIKRYEKIKLQISELEEEAGELKEVILPLIPPDTKVQLKEGVLSLVNRPKWDYSGVVKSLEENLKQTKAQEQADGTAEKKDNYILEYRKDKPKDEEES